MPIARVAGAFGVRGEMKVDLLTDFPERFKGLQQVYLAPDLRPLTIETSRRHGEQVVLKVTGFESPGQVSELRGLELLVPREQAVDLPADHYFLDDLIGVMVRTEAGRELGPVRDVLRTGSNDVYVVGAGRDEILIPGTREAVRELDLKQRRMTVESWILEDENSSSTIARE